MRALPLALLLGGLLWSTPALAAWQPEAQLSPTDAATPAYRTVFPEFAQNNPEWGHVRFHEHRTLGAKGCAILSAYIIARHAGSSTASALTFTESLRGLNSFDRGGRLRWSRVGEFAPLVMESMPAEVAGEAIYPYALQQVRNGSFVAVQLRTPLTREHWVAGIGLENDDLLIIDPAGGRRGLFRESYLTSHIQKVVVFHRLPMRLAAAL